jgi:hypothetical protein
MMKIQAAHLWLMRSNSGEFEIHILAPIYIDDILYT